MRNNGKETKPITRFLPTSRDCGWAWRRGHTVYYAYDDCRKLEQSFFLWSSLRISEDTDIIGISITIKCMEWWTSQFKLVLQSAIGGLTLLPNFQDIFHLYVPPPSFTKQDEYAFYSKCFWGGFPCGVCVDGWRPVLQDCGLGHAVLAVAMAVVAITML